MPDFSQLTEEAFAIWVSGGWLMVPLFLLALFIYYTAFGLLLRLQAHYLLRERAHHIDASDTREKTKRSRSLLLEGAQSTLQVRRHFAEVQQHILPVINRRIRFLAAIIAAGPLLGLLGTVTGMLSTFKGLGDTHGDKIGLVSQGISEALVTTQTGLMIAIPALVLLAFILERRNRLVRALAHLEQLNLRSLLAERRTA